MTAASATESLVYQYGCPAWYDLPPQLLTGPWPAEEGCEGPQGPPGQLLLASRLWNRLVEVQQTHEKEKAAIWASVPEVAAAQAPHDVAQASLDARYDKLAVRYEATLHIAAIAEWLGLLTS